MSFSKIIDDLDSHLKSGEKKREALQSLLHSGRISQNTYDLMEKRISHLTSIVTDLKETLDKEESFWNASVSEETRILESILIELELMHLLGEIREEEWLHKSKVINLGLDSLQNNRTLTDKPNQEPALPIQTKLEEHAINRIVAELKTKEEQDPSQSPALSDRGFEHVGEENIASVEHPQTRRRKWPTKEPPDIESSFGPRAHCMNPWKRECRNTDIKLSIYYNGRMTPICRRCWEDISEKNIEWSSL